MFPPQVGDEMKGAIVAECGCVDSAESETCVREPSDWVIGFDSYTPRARGRWFLCRESGGQYSTHLTHNEALADALATDPNVGFFHERTGGGCLGEFDPNESPYSDDDETC